jgi:uncharacterized membrane protein (UPF0127 family)
MIFVTILAFFIASNNPKSAVTEFLASAGIPTPKPKATMQVGSQTITVDIASSPEQKQQGLSGRSTLANTEGLLFVFLDENNIPGFWMKDMLIPIDIIWIKDGKIVQIDENAQPEPGVPNNLLKVYAPPASVEDVDYVLEVPAGFASRHGVTLDMPIAIPTLNY